jgi:hypothetical protein
VEIYLHSPHMSLWHDACLINHRESFIFFYIDIEILRQLYVVKALKRHVLTCSPVTKLSSHSLLSNASVCGLILRGDVTVLHCAHWLAHEAVVIC